MEIVRASFHAGCGFGYACNPGAFNALSDDSEAGRSHPLHTYTVIALPKHANTGCNNLAVLFQHAPKTLSNDAKGVCDTHDSHFPPHNVLRACSGAENANHSCWRLDHARNACNLLAVSGTS
jgi:hypothetical protein